MVQVERARRVRNGKPHIGGALNNVTLRARVLGSDIVRCAGDNTGSFDGSPWANNDFPPGLKQLHPRSLVCFDGSLCDLQRDSLRGDPALIKLSPRSRQKKQPLSSAGVTAVEWVGRCRNLRHQGSLGYRPASFGGARDSEVAQRLSGDRPPPQLQPAKQFVIVRALEPGVIDFA